MNENDSETNACDVFISYSRKDMDAVLGIKAEIERALGLKCWIDLKGVKSGSEFTQDIIDAIDASTAFLFFLSASSQESKWSLNEIDYAKSEHKHVVLVRFNADPMTKKFRFEFGRTDIIDWRDSLQKGKLLRDLKNWSSQRQLFNAASKDDVHVKFRKKYDWLKEEQFPSIGEPCEPGVYQTPDGGWQCTYGGKWDGVCCAVTIRPGDVEPHETHGTICARWWYQEGGTSGWLGYPISDEEIYYGDDDSDDRISHFENGDIIWKAKADETRIININYQACPEKIKINNKFQAKYDWLKKEQFPSVGEPIEPGIYQTPDGGWQCNYGNWCAITLRPGQTEPHEVHGAICARWYQEGGAFNERCERGWLGYPISDEEGYEGNGNSDDRISHFENGDIIWNSQTNECHVVSKGPDEHQEVDTSCCKVHDEEARKARKGARRRTRVGKKDGETSSRPCHSAGECKTVMLPGGAEMEMIYCPPGEFIMGSPATERGRDDDETQHCVRLTRGFWLGKYPVTQQQWQSVMGTKPSKFKGDDLPVETVSWEDCQKFIKKVKTRIGCGVRLPTEAEWEYACRAGTIGKFGGSGILKELGWYFGNSARNEIIWHEKSSLLFGKTRVREIVKKRQSHLVGKKAPNAWGLYDMHGNIWEWCMDRYGDYAAGNMIDPKGATLGDLRVLRGGCWNYKADDCRSSCRNHDAPDRRSRYYGFRLCCSE